MPKGGGHIIGRLIAGIAVLVALLLFAPPAFAHGQASGPSVDRANLVWSVGLVGSGDLVQSMSTQSEKMPGGGCSGGMSCCVLGQCSIATIAFSATSGTGYRPCPVEAAYPGLVLAPAVGLRAGPATPPPRLNV